MLYSPPTQCPGLNVPVIFGSFVEQHLDIFVFDVLLHLLYPLKADAGGTDDEGGPRLHLVLLNPAVGTEVISSVWILDVVLDTVSVLFSAALLALDPVASTIS